MVFKKFILTKKGIAFTMLSVILSAIILTTFFFNQQVGIDESVEKTGIRVKTINQYLNQLDIYIPSQIKSTTRGVLLNLTNEMIYSKPSAKYYPGGNKFVEQFANCHMTGEIQKPRGGKGDCVQNLGDVLYLMDRLAQDELNIPSNLTVTGISIYQIDPWNVMVEANVSINIVDSFAQWHLNKTYITNVSILGLPDPTYSVDVDGTVSGVSYPLTITTRLEDVNWTHSPSTLNIFALDELYFAYPSGPSYIDRLQGELDNSGGVAGIVSVVIPTDKPYSPDIPHVDYMFWRQEDCPSGSTAYRTFELYNSPATAEIRSELNVSEDSSDRSIHRAILPFNLINQSEMVNSNYYFVTPC